jgi:hypothetical protein
MRDLLLLWLLLLIMMLLLLLLLLLLTALSVCAVRLLLAGLQDTKWWRWVQVVKRVCSQQQPCKIARWLPASQAYGEFRAATIQAGTSQQINRSSYNQVAQLTL